MTCPLCQNSTNIIYLEKCGIYKILYCSDCQLQFSYPMEDPGAPFYQQCGLYESRSESSQTPAEVPLNDWRYQTCLKLCISRPNQSLLDIGCGDGAFLTLAQGNRCNVFAIDIDDRSVRLAKDIRNIEHVECGSWEKLQLINGWKDFDIITLFDMLEHVSLPVSLITTIFELLKPGGLICLTVPRLDRYPKIFDIEADHPPHHFTLWTPNSLNRLLKKAGFIDIRIIEKPLMEEDILLHLRWRTRRLIKKLGKKQGNRHAKNTGDTKSSPMHAIKKVIAKPIKKSILLALSVVGYFLRRTHLGRGHTLLAVAKKPVNE